MSKNQRKVNLQQLWQDGIRKNKVLVKVLNPVGRDCLNFSMEWDVPPSHPISTLGIQDMPRRPDRDVGMLVGWLCLDTWNGILFRCPVGCPVGTWIIGPSILIRTSSGWTFEHLLNLLASLFTSSWISSHFMLLQAHIASFIIQQFYMLMLLLPGFTFSSSTIFLQLHLKIQELDHDFVKLGAWQMLLFGYWAQFSWLNTISILVHCLLRSESVV